MKTMFGAKWTSSMGREPSAVFAKAMQNLHSDTVTGVLAKLRDDRVEWPPTDLAAFMILVDRVLCDRYQIPDKDEALRMARAGDWSVGVVWETARRTGCSFGGLAAVCGSGTVPANQTPRFFRVWGKNWQAVVREVTSGATFAKPETPEVVALPATVPQSKSDLWAARDRNGLDALRKRVGLKPRVRPENLEVA